MLNIKNDKVWYRFIEIQKLRARRGRGMAGNLDGSVLEQI